MRGLKRGIAFAMASTMLLGSGISAMADGSSVTGDGHYTQENIEETISVTLPTQPEGETPFDYVMDPRGNVPHLVADGSAVFGEDLNDVAEENLPGLYYVTGTERIDGKDVPVFSAKSDSLKLINESACDVAVGVDFEVKVGDADFSNDAECYQNAKIRGVGQLDDAHQNELMLSLYASNGDEATDDKVMPVFVEDDGQQDYDVVSETVYYSMAGKEDNFVFTLTEDEGLDYVCEYNRKQNVEFWPAVDFYMSGKINEFVDELPDDLVRPQVTITWSILSESGYNELVGNDNAFDELRETRALDTYEDLVQPSIDGDIFAAEDVPEGEALVVHFNKGDSEGITSLQYFDGNTWVSLPGTVDIDNEAGTITFAAVYVDAFRVRDISRTWRATFAPIGDDDPVSEEFEIVSLAD